MVYGVHRIWYPLGDAKDCIELPACWQGILVIIVMVLFGWLLFDVVHLAGEKQPVF